MWGTKSYAYDAVGNPTAFGGLVNRTLAFTGTQVTSGTGLTGVSYDAAGNMTHKVIDGVAWDYAWTGEGQLAAAKKNDALLAQMTYDADGQRVKKVYSPSTGPTVTTTYIGKLYEKRVFSDGSPDRHTLHLFANGQHIESVTKSGAILTAFRQANGWRAEVAAASLYDAHQARGAGLKALQYLRAAGAHPGFARWSSAVAFIGLALLFVILLVRSRSERSFRIARSSRLRLAAGSLAMLFTFSACSGAGDPRIGARSDELLTGDTTGGPPVGAFYYHSNQINSSSVVTDSYGNETTRIVYLPFGEVSQPNSSGGDTVTAKFTGQELDEELGLYYYGARYYDPAIGRFISADNVVPGASNAQCWNRYSYVNNNPIVYVDPTGHFLDFIGDILAIINPFWALSSIIWTQRTINYYADSAVTAWEGIKQMIAHPSIATIAGFVVAASISAYTRQPYALLAWAKATAAAIAVTSMAQTAGVSSPVVLSLIGALAAVAGGGATIGNFIRGVGAWGVGMGLHAVGGDKIGDVLAVVNALAAAAMAVNSISSQGADAPTTSPPKDPGRAPDQFAAADQESDGTATDAGEPVKAISTRSDGGLLTEYQRTQKIMLGLVSGISSVRLFVWGVALLFGGPLSIAVGVAVMIVGVNGLVFGGLIPAIEGISGRPMDASGHLSLSPVSP